MAPIVALQMSARMAQIGQCVQIRGVPALGKRIAGTERKKQREYHSWNENSGNSFHEFGFSWNECLCAQGCTPRTRGSEPLRAPCTLKHGSRRKVTGRSATNYFVEMLNCPFGQPRPPPMPCSPGTACAPATLEWRLSLLALNAIRAGMLYIPPFGRTIIGTSPLAFNGRTREEPAPILMNRSRTTGDNPYGCDPKCDANGCRKPKRFHALDSIHFLKNHHQHRDAT